MQSRWTGSSATQGHYSGTRCIGQTTVQLLLRSRWLRSSLPQRTLDRQEKIRHLLRRLEVRIFNFDERDLPLFVSISHRKC